MLENWVEWRWEVDLGQSILQAYSPLGIMLGAYIEYEDEKYFGQCQSEPDRMGPFDTLETAKSALLAALNGGG